MATKLTAQAQEGYSGGAADTANPYIYSSPNWYAFEAGRALYRTGRCAPVKATMGRGYRVNINTAATEFQAVWNINDLCILDRITR